MPAKLFFELNEEKRNKIIDIGILEFATYGYENSSTNRIVTSCGISKGSLFKYFSTKEDFYFSILDIVTTDFIESLRNEMCDLSTELFARVIEYSALEFSWYIKNPEKAKFIIGAFTKKDTKIYHKTIKRYASKELTLYYDLAKDIELHNFRWDKQKTLNILKWFLNGFNENFLETVQTDSASFEQLQKEYEKSLTEHLELLKTGLLK